MNGIAWERFSPQQQAAEIDEPWPEAGYEPGVELYQRGQHLSLPPLGRLEPLGARCNKLHQEADRERTV